ncbi:hypothetical protein TNCV_771651 [Trichonephila clavipes]|nr:hypothetical protein TNCV_771651 [Trichonephila clavipes]
MKSTTSVRLTLGIQRSHIRITVVWFRSTRRRRSLKDNPQSRVLRGRGSRVVLVSERGLLCHGFEPSTTKDPPCRAAMHVKSVES